MLNWRNFMVSILASVLAAIIVAGFGRIGGIGIFLGDTFSSLDQQFTVFRLFLVVIFFVILLILFPGLRALVVQPFYRVIVNSARLSMIRAFDDFGELASSLIIFLKRQDKNGIVKYYCLLEGRRVENARYDGPGGMVLMYPGKRISIMERPDTAALDYVKKKFNIQGLELSPHHHHITSEEEYPRKTTTQVPCPFRVLLEVQPQRGSQAYNYDMIYVALCSGGISDKLPELPANCQWRRLREIREEAFMDMLDDVKRVILEAAEKLPEEHGSKGVQQ